METAPLSKWFSRSFAAVSAVGFLDALYLTVEHYLNQGTACFLVSGCDRVLESQYAMLAPNVPIALAGVLYYGTLLGLAIAYLRTRNHDTFRFAAMGTVVGLLASFYFIYLQFFVIKAICIYCMLSAVTSLTLFVLGLIAFSKLRSAATASQDAAR